jgi:uncharacterized membrane protein
MLAGSALIAAYSLAYFDFETLPPFAVERLPDRFAAVWLGALRVHVAAALPSLPLCLALSTRWLQRRTTWHRRLGRVAASLVLFALVPSGALLALHAKGGPPVGAGFLLSAAIVGGSMVYGVMAARRGDAAAHRRAMHHVVAQMSVAVTSRTMLLGFDAVGVDPDAAYVIALWVPVIASAVVAELVSSHKKGSRREASSSGFVLRIRSLAGPFVRLGR